MNSALVLPSLRKSHNFNVKNNHLKINSSLDSFTDRSFEKQAKNAVINNKYLYIDFNSAGKILIT